MENFKTIAYFLSLFSFVFLALSCSNTTDFRKDISGVNTSNLSIPTPTSKTEKEKEEKSFTFVVQGGKEIKGSIFPNKVKPGGKTIIFAPFLDKTDGNLYNAALNSLWSVYGKNRGLFQLADAKTELDNDLGGNAICWDISNPNQQFCVFPEKDSETGGIGVLHIWLK